MKEIEKGILPQKLAEETETLWGRLCELKIREGRRCIAVLNGTERILNYIPGKEDIAEIIKACAGYSMVSSSDELRQGFVTARGGIRAGIAGRFSSENGKVTGTGDYSSVILRFPRQVFGIAAKISGYLKSGGKFLSTLIISAPGMGKTTLLRDMVVSVSEGDGFIPMNCAVIDERGELFPRGFKRGLRTDVLSFCPKETGIGMALRSLSPGLIAFDEMGSEKELFRAAEASLSGTAVLTSAHAGDIGSLMKMSFYKKLLEKDIFKRIVILSDSLGVCTVECITDSTGCPVYKGRMSLLETPGRKDAV